MLAKGSLSRSGVGGGHLNDAGGVAGFLPGQEGHSPEWCRAGPTDISSLGFPTLPLKKCSYVSHQLLFVER